MAKSHKDALGRLAIEQLNAIDLLITGASDRDVAARVGVSRSQVCRWRNYDPDFGAEVNRRRAEVWGRTADRLRALLPRALDRVAEALDDPICGATAAFQLLKLAGVERLDLGATGPTDAAAIIEAEAADRFTTLATLTRPNPTELERARADFERRAALVPGDPPTVVADERATA